MMLSLLTLLTSIAEAREAAVILVSDQLPEYEQTAKAFADSYPGLTQIIQIEGSKAKSIRIANDLRNDPPPIIFAIGTKAAYTSIQKLDYIPCIYAMVHDPIKYGIYGDKVTGIMNHPSVDVTLAQVRLFIPKAKKIGIFISDASNVEVPTDASEVAQEMSYSIEFIRVNTNEDIRKEMRNIHDRVDALWLMPDSTLITPDNFHTITMMANRHRLPVITNSERLAQAGALFSVIPDLNGIGQQAAELAVEIVKSETDFGGITFTPEIPNVIFNPQTQRTIGLELDPFAEGFIDSWTR